MQTLAGFAADLVVVMHAAYVLFVIGGQLLILVGWLRRWKWVHGIWFRGVHFAAIGTVVLESWVGITCPLTTWENWLRAQAGQSTYRGEFIGRMVHDLLFVELAPSVLTTVYTLFGLLVLLTFFLVPPGKKENAASAGPNEELHRPDAVH